MTAPPAQMPIVSAAHAYFSTASTASDSMPWTSMAPSLPLHNVQRQRSPPSASANDSNDNALLWITGNKPADFRVRSVMTKVRRKAMGSYLKNGRKPKRDAQGQRPRLHSEGNSSTRSRASVGSEEGDDHARSASHALRILGGEKRKVTRQPSSSLPSPASAASNHEHRVSNPDTQISRIAPTLDLVLSSAPIVQPMRVGVPLPFNGTSPQPFKSIGKPLDPFRTMFQAHHPRVSVEELKFHCSHVFGTRAMGQHWIPTLVKSPNAFLSTLCIASAHYDAIKDRDIESVQTTALRQEVIYLIQQSLLNPQAKVDDYNVIALTQLIASEIIAGEEAALTFHEGGVEAMVTARGGLNRLGANGRLASTLSWVSLESAILRETTPRSMYTNFCAANLSRNYPNTATIPESPLFCPRTEFQTVARSSRCSPRTLDLLRDIRMMMDLFLHETRHSRQNSQSLKNLYKKITTHYPAAVDLQKDTILNYSDWTYEAIRIASLIQATAIIKGISLSEALKYASQSETPASLYSASSYSRSNESLVSPMTLRNDSPVIGFSTSPSYATNSTLPEPNYFNLAPPRASVSSTTSNIPFFPPPAAPIPTSPSALLTNLRTAIENSDMSDCWSDMAGVLWWIALVTGSASRRSDKVLKKWYRALAVRCSILLCFEHPEPVHATLLRMSEVISALGPGTKPSESVVRAEGNNLNVKKRKY